MSNINIEAKGIEKPLPISAGIGKSEAVKRLLAYDHVEA